MAPFRSEVRLAIQDRIRGEQNARRNINEIRESLNHSTFRGIAGTHYLQRLQNISHTNIPRPLQGEVHNLSRQILERESNIDAVIAQINHISIHHDDLVVQVINTHLKNHIETIYAANPYNIFKETVKLLLSILDQPRLAEGCKKIVNDELNTALEKIEAAMLQENGAIPDEITTIFNDLSNHILISEENKILLTNLSFL